MPVTIAIASHTEGIYRHTAISHICDRESVGILIELVFHDVPLIRLKKNVKSPVREISVAFTICNESYFHQVTRK